MVVDRGGTLVWEHAGTTGTKHRAGDPAYSHVCIPRQAIAHSKES